MSVFFTDALFRCCNTENFPTVGLIKEHLILSYLFNSELTFSIQDTTIKICYVTFGTFLQQALSTSVGILAHRAPSKMEVCK